MAAGTLQVRLTAALNGPGWEFTAMVWSRLRIGDRRGSFGARHRGSMTRYIVLELAEFLAELQKAEAQGVRARGAEPVTVHPIMMMVNKALEQVVAGDADAASKSLASAGKVMAAVDRMVHGAGEPYASDWKARTAAMLADLSAAQAK